MPGGFKVVLPPDGDWSKNSASTTYIGRTSILASQSLDNLASKRSLAVNHGRSGSPYCFRSRHLVARERRRRRAEGRGEWTETAGDTRSKVYFRSCVVQPAPSLAPVLSQLSQVYKIIGVQELIVSVSE